MSIRRSRVTSAGRIPAIAGARPIAAPSRRRCDEHGDCHTVRHGLSQVHLRNIDFARDLMLGTSQLFSPASHMKEPTMTIVSMVSEQELRRIRHWADAKIASGQEPPLAWYQYMKLVETLDAIIAGMGVTAPTQFIEPRVLS